MAILSIVDYIHELRAAGFTERQAEIQAMRLEQVVIEVENKIKEDFKQQNLATKQDLQIALRDQEIRLIKWLIGTGVATMLALGGMISKGFHWF